MRERDRRSDDWPTRKRKTRISTSPSKRKKERKNVTVIKTRRKTIIDHSD